MTDEDDEFVRIEKESLWRKRQIEENLGQPIYFKPKKEWEDLTEEEIDHLIVHHMGAATKHNIATLMKLAIQKAKEKNNV